MRMIILGDGSGMCIIEVNELPAVGDKIFVTRSMMVWQRTSSSDILINSTVEILSRAENDTAAGQYGVLPHFGARTAK